MSYAILLAIVFSIIYSRIFLRKNKLTWLFSSGSAIVLICLNSVRESLWLEWQHHGYTKSTFLLFFALLFIGVQFFLFKKPGLRFFNSILALIILELTPYLSPELQIQTGSPSTLRLNLILLNFTLLDISYKLLFVGSLLVSLLLLLLTNESAWDIPRYSLDYLSEKERKRLIKKFTLARVIREYADQNEKIRKLSRRIINDIYEISYRLIGFGHFLLTLANIIGCIWANEYSESLDQFYELPTERASLITWFTFTVYLWFRVISKATKLQTSWIGFNGFISVCLSIITLLVSH